MKSKNLLILPIALFMVAFTAASTPVPTSAQAGFTDEMQRGNIPQSSGLVDDSGNPISIEEYESMRQESQKNVFQRNTWILPVVLVVLIGGGAAVLLAKKK